MNRSATKAGKVLQGSVLSNEGKILPSVNVTNMQTNFQVQTNEDGQFSIPYESDTDWIKFSHVGYTWDSIQVKDFYSLIELYPSSEILDDVTVTGSGKNKDNTMLWFLGGIALATIIAIRMSKRKPQPKKTALKKPGAKKSKPKSVKI